MARTKSIIFALICILMAGFTFSIENNTEVTKVIWIYSIDHRIENHPSPVNIVTAEMAPGETWSSNVLRDPGRYFCVWADLVRPYLKNRYVMRFTVPDGAARVRITPFNYFIS